MKKVTFIDMQILKWALPAGIAVAGIAVMAIQSTHQPTKAALKQSPPAAGVSQTVESPAPTATPSVTVNGKRIPVGKDGTADVSVGDGKTHVEVSDGNTQITTTTNEQSGDTSNQQSNHIQVNMNSANTGGTNSGTTRVFGTNFSSNNGTSSFNSTHVFSTGLDHVSVSQK
jgi:hypothetical protein